MYQGASTLEAYHAEVTAAVSKIGLTYEIVIVDDGSTDGGAEKLKAIHARDPEHVRVVRLSRNFGHHAAAYAGLARARGGMIFLIDTDLQDDPALLPSFLEARAQHGVDMVYGYQERRVAGFFERVSGAIFWRVFTWASDLKMTESPRTIRVMTRRYVDAFLALKETHRFTAAMMEWVGFPQHKIPVVPRPRHSGKSTYTFARKLNLTLTAITSFSALPLKLATRGGFVVTSLGLLYAAEIVIEKLLHPEAIFLGWASLMALGLIIGGLNMFLMGIIGIYLARTYEQGKMRPSYIVMEELDVQPREMTSSSDSRAP